MRLAHRGANHSPDNIFIHFPHQRTIALVDVVIPGWVPFRSLTVATDVPGYLLAHDQLLEYDVDTVVGGHLTRLGTPEDVVTNRAYLRDLFDLTARAMANISIASVKAKLGAANAYRVADAYYETIARQVNAQLIDRWAERLGGVDVFAHSHAVTAVDTLRFDYNLDGGAPFASQVS